MGLVMTGGPLEPVPALIGGRPRPGNDESGCVGSVGKCSTENKTALYALRGRSFTWMFFSCV